MLNGKIGICLVGPGFWAKEMHLPAFSTIPGVEVVSIVGRTEDAARALAQRFNIQRWSTEYREAFKSDDVDIVDILAPNYLHAPIAIAAAEAGKHVICIKPLATTLDEADQIIAATEKAGTRLFYAENVPFIPAV